MPTIVDRALAFAEAVAASALLFAESAAEGATEGATAIADAVYAYVLEQTGSEEKAASARAYVVDRML